MVTNVSTEWRTCGPLGNGPPPWHHPRTPRGISAQLPCRWLDLVVHTSTCCSERCMSGERRGKTFLEHIAQGRQSGQATVIGKLTCQLLTGRTGIPHMALVQRRLAHHCGA
jgi:hypothetical protein